MRRSSFSTKAVALGILFVASVIGNVSMSASRARPDSAVTVPAAVAVARQPLEVETQSVSMERSVPPATPSAEAGQIVPALYSWDPDVTFVFYRHVAKWM